jgi:hypothetical protein
MQEVDFEVELPKGTSFAEWSEDLTPRGIASLIFLYLFLTVATAICGITVKDSCKNSNEVLKIAGLFIFEAILLFIAGLYWEETSIESPFMTGSLFFTINAIWAVIVILTNFSHIIG